MTRDSAMRGAWPSKGARPLDPDSLLIAVLLAGLGLRVFIALVFWQSGFQIDIGDYAAWAGQVVAVGPGAFYASCGFCDYPPGYLYVLTLLGSIGATSQQLVGVDVTVGLVKLPGILADLGVAALLWSFGRRYASSWVGIAGASLYLFNPGVVFDSAVWGQIDSVGTLVVLGALYALARGWTEAASAGAALALLVKFQFGFLVPLVALVAVKRHLFGRSADGEHDGIRNPWRLLAATAAGIGTLLVLSFPFGMTLYWPLAGGDPGGLLGILPEADPDRSLVGKLFQAAGTYQGLSVNAFNMWRLAGGWIDPAVIGNRGQWWGLDTGPVALPGGLELSWQAIGALLFAGAALVGLWVAWRRDTPYGLVLGTLVLAVAFFALPTRVHERYLFPALALGALLAPLGWRWAAGYVALSVAFFLNIYWVYTLDWSFAGPRVLNPGLGGGPMQRDPLLDAILSPPSGTAPWQTGGIGMVSLLVVVTLGWLLVESLVAGLRRVWAADLAGTTSAEPPPVSHAADRVGRPPERTTVSGSAQREPPRRLDRLDALILVAMLLGALVFRLWRLDEPRAMHFDEVYHARSATEWLANWENGWSQDVYEWTHPMLAKYLIAAGIVVADPNRVVERRELDQPAPALAIAPRRAAFGYERSILFAAAGSQIVATDALTGEPLAGWSAAGPVSALAYDERGERLLVGTATSGRIAVYDLSAWRTVPVGAGPPATERIETSLADVAEIVAPAADEVLLVRGSEGASVVDRTGAEVVATDRIAAAGVAYLPELTADDGSRELAPQVVVTDPQRRALLYLDAETLDPSREEVALPATPVGPLAVIGSGRDQRLWVPIDALPATDEHPAVDGGLAIVDPRGTQVATVPLPGRPSLLIHQPVANVVYVAGDGEVWTVSPHGESRSGSAIGFSAYDTTRLDGEPLALAVDASSHDPADDHARLLVATGSAQGPALVGIDAGSNGFAWRLAGIVFGSLLAGLVYLLAASIFRRRRVAVLAGLFMAFDAMSYTMSRISMNDIFVAAFIVAAYLVFWQVWSGRWARSAWWALPLAGFLVGLAAASKWVGFYALAGLLLLVLLRSGLGRLLVVGGLAFGIFAAGIGAPWPFLVVVVGALAVSLAAVLREPVRIGLEDLLGLAGSGVMIGGLGLAFYLGGLGVEGREPRNAVEYLFGLLAQGAQAGWPALLLLAVLALLLAGRAIASLRDPTSDRRWFEPGEMAGFAWPWVGACLVLLPLVVYALSYLPYLGLGHTFSGPDAGPGYGWPLDELQAQMFGYHFGLTSGHPAWSPWWSWPLDLKTVWFYAGDFDGDRLAMIFNGGNPILFWAAVPAIASAGVAAWRHGSLGLVFLVVSFAVMWLPWTRIERVTFQYHYLAALPFALIAVAWVIDAALRSWTWRPFAVSFLVLAVVVGILIFPLGSALPMPDWYITAAGGLPPWNYGFQFPDPPPGERGDLLSGSGLLLLGGTIAAAAAMLTAVLAANRAAAPPPAAAPPAR